MIDAEKNTYGDEIKGNVNGGIRQLLERGKIGSLTYTCGGCDVEKENVNLLMECKKDIVKYLNLLRKLNTDASADDILNHAKQVVIESLNNFCKAMDVKLLEKRQPYVLLAWEKAKSEFVGVGNKRKALIQKIASI